MRVRVGVTLPQFREDGSDLIEGSRRAVDAGLDSLWLFDHLWPLGNKERPIMECWSGLAYLAASTRSVGVGTLVTRSTLRIPAVLASMAATVGAIAPDRVTVGVGSGDAGSASENRAFGIPYLRGEERRRQLEDVVATLVRRRNQGSSSFRVWVGGNSERVMAIAAQWAAGYNCWGLSAAEVEARRRSLKMQGAEIEMTWGGQVIVGKTQTDAEDRLGRRDPAAYLVGNVDAVAERLLPIVDAGAHHIVLASPFAAEAGTYELLGRVAAEVREGALG